MKAKLILHGVHIGTATVDAPRIRQALNGHHKSPEEFIQKQADWFVEKLEAILNESLELLSRETYMDAKDSLSGDPVSRERLIYDAEAIVEAGIIKRSPFPENDPQPKPIGQEFHAAEGTLRGH